jgi:hypothetical protein
MITALVLWFSASVLAGLAAGCFIHAGMVEEVGP